MQLTIYPQLTEALVVLAPLAVAPLGLRLAAPRAPGAAAPLWKAAARFQLPAAVLLLAAFLLPPGMPAALLVAPWFGFTILVGLLGLARFVARSGGPVEELAIDLGLIYLLVGGAWVLASRGGVQFLGFDEPIVLLTGAHFHYAGFALPILTGLAARAAARSGPPWIRRLHRAAAIGVVLGVPLTAVGITFGSRGHLGVEAVAAAPLLISAALSAALQLRLGLGRTRLGEQALLVLSALALLGGMGFAGAYALGRALGTAWLDIPTMVAVHGAANAIGFAIGGLIGWLLILRSDVVADTHPIAEWERRQIAPGAEAGPRAGDARDVHEAEVAAECPGEPEAGGSFRRAADSILRYDIFPPRLVTPVLRRHPVAVGDAVGCRYRIAPFLEVFFASRVVAAFDEARDGTWRTGFTYRTLEGHPELGEETFSVEKDLATGRVTVALRSWSRPGTWVTRLGYPVTRRLQIGASRAALEHLRARAVRAGSTRLE